MRTRRSLRPSCASGVAALLLAALIPRLVLADLTTSCAFNIAPQQLSSALITYSQQCHIQVTTPASLLEGRETHGVTGQLIASAALERLLRDTDLTFDAIDANTVVIRLRGSATSQAQPPVLPTPSVSTAPSTRTSPREGEAHASLEEVVVSARKRDEALADVPQSVTVLTASDLTNLNIQSFSDYATRVPNLSFSYGTGGLGFITSRSISIRGIAGPGTTTLYIDDTPVPESLDVELADITRIEVLKGPQGTLYGQGSLGGNVRLITVPATQWDQSSYVNVESGFTSGAPRPDFLIEGALTLPSMPEWLQVRTVAAWREDAGFLTRRYLVGTGSELASDNNQGAITAVSGTLALEAHPRYNLTVMLRIMAENQDAHGWPATWASLPQFEPEFYVVQRVANVQERSTGQWYLPALEVGFTAGGWSLNSSTSYFSRSATDLEDGTEGTAQTLAMVYGLHVDPRRAIPWDGYFHDRRVVHETRINVAPVHGFSAIAGIYLAKNSLDGVLDSHDIPGIAAAGLWPTDLGWYSDNTITYRDAAVFGELYYRWRQLEFTLGARDYWERQNGHVYFAGALNGGQLTDQTLVETTQHGISPKFAIAYHVSPESEVYTYVSRGFRPGGAGETLPTICASDLIARGLDPTQPTRYGSDTVWNYEIGAKTRRATILFTGALFDMEWRDIQQPVTLPTCFVTFTTNAGSARVRGGEVEMAGTPYPWLEANLRVGMEDAYFTNTATSNEYVGSRIPTIPVWTVTAAVTYTRPLGSRATGFLGFDVRHIGDAPEVSNGGGPPLILPAYNLLNGRLGVRWNSSEVALYASNITNVEVNLGALNPISYVPYDAQGNRRLRVAVLPPFQAGVQYRYTF